jgi:hypothetical protein
VYYPENENVCTFDARGEAARASAEIFTSATGEREGGEKKETVGDRVDQAGSNLHAGAFLGDIKPDVIKISFSVRRYTMRHLSGQFSNQAGASALSHFGGKLPHGFLRDDAALASGKRSAGIIERRQKRHTSPFAFFPQGKRLLYGFFLALQAPAFDGAPGECFLIGRKLHFHPCLSSQE